MLHILVLCMTNFLCGSSWLSQCKVIYYVIFSWMYGFVGSFTHLAMVNSSWTRSHIEKLWKIPDRTKRVYPPCDTSVLQVCLLMFPEEILLILSSSLYW